MSETPKVCKEEDCPLPRWGNHARCEGHFKVRRNSRARAKRAKLREDARVEAAKAAPPEPLPDNVRPMLGLDERELRLRELHERLEADEERLGLDKADLEQRRARFQRGREALIDASSELAERISRVRIRRQMEDRFDKESDTWPPSVQAQYATAIRGYFRPIEGAPEIPVEPDEVLAEDAAAVLFAPANPEEDAMEWARSPSG